jgi:hypothetical protein
MTTTSVLTPERVLPTVADQRKARVRLGTSVELPGTEHTDGIWWPRSLDLVRELRPLLSELAAAGHMARRVTYNLDAWQPAPSKMAVNGYRLRLGGYRRLSPRVLHVTSPDSTAPLVLLVLPPSADPVIADAALSAVTPRETS